MTNINRDVGNGGIGPSGLRAERDGEDLNAEIEGG